jgi:hypothetical protein
MSAERRLRLVFTGEDNSGHAIKSVSDSLKDLKGAVMSGKESLKEERQAYSDSISVLRERQRQERNLSLEFKQNHSNFFRTADAVATVGRTALTVNSIWQNYNLTQLRVREMNKEVSDSTRRVHESISRYGAGSVEARREIEHYNKVLAEQKRLNDELPAQYLTMGLSALYAARPISQMTQKLSTWAQTARLARQTGSPLTGALSNIALGAGGASLLGSGRLGRLAPLLGRGGLFATAAIGGATAGGFLGRELLKLRYGEKEGEERFRGVMGQLGLKDIMDELSGNGPVEGVGQDNSINAGQINIYVNDLKTAQDLRASLQQEASRQQSEG